MGVEPPPKYVNREFKFLNWHMRPSFTFLVKVMGLPLHPCSCGVQHTCVKYINVIQMIVYAQQVCFDSWVRHCRSLATALSHSGTAGPGCGTAALAATAQVRTSTTQHVTHIKKYILAQIYVKLQHRLIHVHIPHI